MKTQSATPINDSSAPANNEDPMKRNKASSAFRIKEILVPLDFSSCSEKALQYAIPFARQFNSRLTLLHVLPVYYSMGWECDATGYEPLIEGDLRKQTETRLNALASEPLSARIPAAIEIRYGAPAIEIVNFAKENDADLILMSTHGRTGRVHAFIGSVASDVTRLAPCPVLVVREHEHEFIPDQPNPFKANQPLPMAPAK